MHKPFYGWFVVAALFTIWTVVFGLQYSFGVFLKSLQDALGCSRGTISLAMTINLLFFALSMVPAGWAINRFNIRNVYSLAAIGIGLPLILCSQVSEPWQLYLLYALLGFSTGIFGPSALTVVIRWFTEKRGLALGLVSAGSGFGTLVVAPLANTLISFLGWRNTFFSLGVASLVILFVCVQYIKNPPEQEPIATGSASSGPTHRDQMHRPNLLQGMTFRQAIRTREFMFIIAGSGTAPMASRMITVHIAPHATDMGLSPFVAAMALSMIGCGSLLGRIAMGSVQDRIGAQRSMIICLTVMGVCLIALPFITSDASFFIFAIVFGLAAGGDVPQTPALTAQCFGMASMAVIYALIIAVGNIVSSISPLAAGYIFDITHSYTIAFIGAGILMFLGVFSISRIK